MRGLFRWFRRQYVTASNVIIFISLTIWYGVPFHSWSKLQAEVRKVVCKIVEAGISAILMRSSSRQYSSLPNFLNKGDEETAIALTSKLAYLEGQPCYEVAIQKMSDGSTRASIPEGYDVTFFYTPDRTRVCVAAGDALAAILDNQKSARYLGVVAYAENGIGWFEWEPKNEIPF